MRCTVKCPGHLSNSGRSNTANACVQFLKHERIRVDFGVHRSTLFRGQQSKAKQAGPARPLPAAHHPIRVPSSNLMRAPTDDSGPFRGRGPTGRTRGGIHVSARGAFSPFFHFIHRRETNTKGGAGSSQRQVVRGACALLASWWCSC